MKSLIYLLGIILLAVVSINFILTHPLILFLCGLIVVGFIWMDKDEKKHPEKWIPVEDESKNKFTRFITNVRSEIISSSKQDTFSITNTHKNMLEADIDYVDMSPKADKIILISLDDNLYQIEYKTNEYFSVDIDIPDTIKYSNDIQKLEFISKVEELSEYSTKFILMVCAYDRKSNIVDFGKITFTKYGDSIYKQYGTLWKAVLDKITISEIIRKSKNNSIYLQHNGTTIEYM